ncbi:MAG: hypothetical protein ACLRZG_08890 [Streptococcus sp.]
MINKGIQDNQRIKNHPFLIEYRISTSPPHQAQANETKEFTI